jgi:shikimate kinase
LVRTPHNGFSRTDSRGDTVPTVSLSPTTTLILIGLRGSGKTTIARLLAQRLNRQAIDLDDLTPTYLREKSAADALSKHGEPAFRRAELAALLDALKTPGAILALGGGTPTAPGVAELLESAKNQGRIVVIYLRASEQTLRARLAQEPAHTRPSLTGIGTLDEIGVLLNLRDTLYKTLASRTIDTDARSVEQIADAILAG